MDPEAGRVRRDLKTQIPFPVDRELKLGVSQARASTAGSIKGQSS